MDEFILHDGYLVRLRKLSIPCMFLRDSLQGIASWRSGWTLRSEQDVEVVERRFYWSSLKGDIAKIVGQCHTC